jgi:hypothetical protein
MVKLREEKTENCSVHKLQSFRIHPKTLKPSKWANKLMFVNCCTVYRRETWHLTFERRT